jgi:hypothetical protein
MMKMRVEFKLLSGVVALGLVLSGCAATPTPVEPEPVVSLPEPAPAPVVVASIPEPVAPAPVPVPEIVRDPYGTILSGVLDLPRMSETAAIDGCAQVHKGLTMAGGFLFFTCEKLLPGIDISRQAEVTRQYADALTLRGWSKQYNSQKKQDEYISHDPYGCKMTVSLKPWTDRSMNEPRGNRRDDFRQIVFMTHFAKGDACEPAYQSFKANGFQF